jgi:DNA-binding MarR family transcriptional regulator
MVDRKREDELREAIELLYFSYRAFTAGPDRILQKRGLGRVHHRILYFISRNPGLSVNELLEVLQISKQALNTPLRQLASMKLVDNSRAPHDARVRELRLTTEGKKLEARLSGTQMLHLEEVFAAAGPKAERGWRDIMQRLSVD